MSGESRDPVLDRISAAISGRSADDLIYFSQVRFVRRVFRGTLSPLPLSAEQEREQADFLDRCLNEEPRGRIIGREVLTGSFALLAESGDGNARKTVTHTRQEILHIGFRRKPYWMNGEK